MKFYGLKLRGKISKNYAKTRYRVTKNFLSYKIMAML